MNDYKIDYKLVRGKFLKDGHTMFFKDVLTDLERLSYLEKRVTEKYELIRKITLLQSLCFRKEGQLSMEIKGHDYNNGYSCALHDIRNELSALKSNLKMGDALVLEGETNG